MRSRWPLLATVLVAAVFAFRLAAARRTAVRPIGEFGEITIPARLDPYAPDSGAGYILFPFDRTSNSFLMMGSNRPVMEGLVVAAWDLSSRREAHEAVKDRVRDRTGNIAWRLEGVWEIGEGMHEVNTTSHPAIVIVRDVPEHNLTIGYFAWTKVASLDDAKRTLDAAIASYRAKASLSLRTASVSTTVDTSHPAGRRRRHEGRSAKPAVLLSGATGRNIGS